MQHWPGRPAYQPPRCPESLAGSARRVEDDAPVFARHQGIVMFGPVLRPGVDALPSCSIAESSQVARLRREPRLARSLTDPLTSWDDARNTLSPDWLFGQVVGLVEEVPQGFDDQVRCFFGQEVAGG